MKDPSDDAMDNEWVILDEKKDGSAHVSGKARIFDQHYSIEEPPILPPLPSSSMKKIVTTEQAEQLPPLTPRELKPLPPLPKKTVVPISIGFGALISTALNKIVIPMEKRHSNRGSKRLLKKKTRKRTTSHRIIKIKK